MERSVEVSLFPMSQDVSTIVPIGNRFRKELKCAHFDAFLKWLILVWFRDFLLVWSVYQILMGYLRAWFCTSQELCDAKRNYIKGNYKGEPLIRSQMEVKQF
jgi:hypothetical protein